jgi:hypothetical protein
MKTFLKVLQMYIPKGLTNVVTVSKKGKREE